MVQDLKLGHNKYLQLLKDLSHRICVIYGTNGVGKDSIKDRLVQTDRFIYNIKYTTRKIKNNETDNIDYHFVDNSYLIKNRSRSIVSYSFFGNYYWDDAKELYNNLITNPNSIVIIIMGNVNGLEAFLQVLPRVHKICILPSLYKHDFIDESISRMINRKRDNIDIIKKRAIYNFNMLDDLKSLSDLIVINSRNKIDESVIEIENYFKKR